MRALILVAGAALAVAACSDDNQTNTADNQPVVEQDNTNVTNVTVINETEDVNEPATNETNNSTQ